jgi:hypothetical protein
VEIFDDIDILCACVCVCVCARVCVCDGIIKKRGVSAAAAVHGIDEGDGVHTEYPAVAAGL